MTQKSILRITTVTALVLSIPLIAMQLSQDVDWNLFDFIVAGLLIFTTGITYETLVKKVSTKRKRLILSLMLGILFILIWAELAVGLFGTPFAGS